MNAQILTIPLFPALVTCVSIVGTVVGIVIWAFTNFERKVDALARHEALEERVTSHERLLQDVANNVSYIRGRLEPK